MSEELQKGPVTKQDAYRGGQYEGGGGGASPGSQGPGGSDEMGSF